MARSTSICSRTNISSLRALRSGWRMRFLTTLATRRGRCRCRLSASLIPINRMHRPKRPWSKQCQLILAYATKTLWFLQRPSSWRSKLPWLSRASRFRKSSTIHSQAPLNTNSTPKTITSPIRYLSTRSSPFAGSLRLPKLKLARKTTKPGTCKVSLKRLENKSRCDKFSNRTKKTEWLKTQRHSRY